MPGAVLIVVMTNGLRLLGVGSIYHNLMKGVIIIVAIARDMMSVARRLGISEKLTLKPKKRR